MDSRGLPTIQLIGDSLARRFGFFLSRSPRFAGRIRVAADFSVSGLTIGGLKELVKNGTVKLSPQHPVLMFIGTNDILRGADSLAVKQQYKSLIRLLRRRFPGIFLIILQVPDFPKIRQDPSALATVAYFNKCVEGFQASDTSVLRVAVPLGEEKYFCKFYGRSRKRDGIHFNDLANAVIRDLVVGCLPTLN